MAGALRVFAGPEAEVEANGDQFGNVVGSWARGTGFYVDKGVNNSHGDGILLLERGILEPVGLGLPRKVLVNPVL